MATVDPLIVWGVNYVLLVEMQNNLTIEVTHKKLGVTGKQWKRYLQSGKLKVRPEVKAKIELIASFRTKNKSHLPTLLKVMEIRGQKCQK